MCVKDIASQTWDIFLRHTVQYQHKRHVKQQNSQENSSTIKINYNKTTNSRFLTSHSQLNEPESSQQHCGHHAESPDEPDQWTLPQKALG